jgi:DNA-binding CsgD family transcriptional regulator
MPIEQNSLTPVERELINLVVAGYWGEELSRSLELSPKDVRHLIASVYAKLAVSGRLELIIYALHAGLVSLPPHS